MDFKQLTLKEWMHLVLIGLLIIGIGMFAINQTLGYFYKSKFLQSPCGLCLELNPDTELCENVDNKINNNEINISLVFPS